MKSATPRKRAPRKTINPVETSASVEPPFCSPKKDQSASPPVIVAIPSTITEKMRAISSLARAVERLAIVLESVNLKVDISNIHIDNTDGVGPAINIGYEQPYSSARFQKED